MSIEGRHVRHEIKTREHYKLIGDGKELPDHLGVAWCGPVIYSHEWKFMSTDHVLLALAGGTSITPCRGCLREIQAVLRAELEPAPSSDPRYQLDSIVTSIVHDDTATKGSGDEHLADGETVTSVGGIPNLCLGCGRELSAYQACVNPACDWERGLDDPHFDRRRR